MSASSVFFVLGFTALAALLWFLIDMAIDDRERHIIERQQRDDGTADRSE